MVIGSQSQNTVEISASVGANAHNRPNDVRVIQDALNQVPPSSGGPLPPLKVDGLCYGKTLAAIRKFQQEACGFKWPDGRIDPNGKTHTRLREFVFGPTDEADFAHFEALLASLLNDQTHQGNVSMVSSVYDASDPKYFWRFRSMASVSIAAIAAGIHGSFIADTRS